MLQRVHRQYERVQGSANPSPERQRHLGARKDPVTKQQRDLKIAELGVGVISKAPMNDCVVYDSFVPRGEDRLL